MTGFEAISHYNGWVMAAFGALIVFSGLAVLSFVISQLPKVFSLFEGKTEQPTVEVVTEKAPATAPELPSEGSSGDLEDLASAVAPLTKELDPPFQLADLYRLCREHDLPHPHLTLSCLQRKGYLVFQGEGAFIWNSDVANGEEG